MIEITGRIQRDLLPIECNPHKPLRLASLTVFGHGLGRLTLSCWLGGREPKTTFSALFKLGIRMRCYSSVAFTALSLGWHSTSVFVCVRAPERRLLLLGRLFRTESNRTAVRSEGRFCDSEQKIV